MQTLEQRLQEISNSTLQNMRFLLESYSSEVLEALDTHASNTKESPLDTLETIQKEVPSVISTLKGIETVITHHQLLQKEAS